MFALSGLHCCILLVLLLPTDTQATVHGLPHRGIEAEVEVELDGIRSAVDAAAKSSPYEVMKEPWVKKAVLVGITLAFIQQWSGVNTVNR